MNLNPSVRLKLVQPTKGILGIVYKMGTGVLLFGLAAIFLTALVFIIRFATESFNGDDVFYTPPLLRFVFWFDWVAVMVGTFVMVTTMIIHTSSEKR